jgi:hypothetical protein
MAPSLPSAKPAKVFLDLAETPDVEIKDHLWYWIVCLPRFRFLMFRWIWRIALWCRFLWRLAKLDLHLVPIHPDGAAGLGYLEIVQTHFTALVLAISIVVSASFAEEISSGKTVFEVIYPASALTLIVELALIFLPPCVFAFRLKACQEKGLSDYMVFAARYVNDFEKKWLNASAIPADPLLGTADLQVIVVCGAATLVGKSAALDSTRSLSDVPFAGWKPTQAKLTMRAYPELTPTRPCSFPRGRGPGAAQAGEAGRRAVKISQVFHVLPYFVARLPSNSCFSFAR